MRHRFDWSKYDSELTFNTGYYLTMVDQISMHLPRDLSTILEIGAGNGVVPYRLDQIRVYRGYDDFLKYFSVEPDIEGVNAALERKIKTFEYIPRVGKIQNVIDVVTENIGMLVTSRSLHEILADFGGDETKLYDILKEVTLKYNPQVVLHGILNRYTGLTQSETCEFRVRQIGRIGHSHNPGTDYLHFEDLIRHMSDINYSLVHIEHHDDPMLIINKSPWRFAVLVFENDN